MNTTTPPHPDQICLLARPPMKYKLDPVRNPPAFTGDFAAFFLRGGYRGNKPDGGLWTSTHTPGQSTVCDWHMGLLRNKVIQLAYPDGLDTLTAFRLTVSAQSRVVAISSVAEALEFTHLYRSQTVPVPSSMRQGAGRLITSEITDWARALTSIDGIRLTAQACDELLYRKLNEGLETSFDTWNCESTLWGRWCFETCEPLDNRQPL